MPEHQLITQQRQLHDLCSQLMTAERLALDTEFVPEYTYSPMLCLIQVATDDLLAVIDPFEVNELAPFWEALLHRGAEVVVHAGKEEMGFCLNRGGRLPDKVFDVQLAAGFVGYGYPTSFANLVWQTRKVKTESTETRTDWRRRPLSIKQIRYALDDVRHLLAIREQLGSVLQARGRAQWFDEEMQALLDQCQSRDVRDRWRRVAGSGGLSPREAAVLRELTVWRDQRARTLDKPAKWVLREDLLIELAKRQPRSIEELQHTRGIGNVQNARWANDLLAAIRLGVELPDEQCPRRRRVRETTDEQMLLKILSAAMIQRAGGENIATGLVGNNEDLRELIRWQSAGAPEAETPRLARGWRAQIGGQALMSILRGETVLRVVNTNGTPRAVFEPAAGSTDK